jgi:PadR family transcriptional regulator, regulatory protein PadR
MPSHKAQSRKDMNLLPDKVTREILLSFWKVHILHHASEGPVYGHWIADELRRHGYNISPGTLYPLLRRMEGNGWLRSARRANAAVNARREYRLAKDGARILALIRTQIEELYSEVCKEAKKLPRPQGAPIWSAGPCLGQKKRR